MVRFLTPSKKYGHGRGAIIGTAPLSAARDWISEKYKTM
jgi:hypothetical protein